MIFNNYVYFKLKYTRVTPGKLRGSHADRGSYVCHFCCRCEDELTLGHLPNLTIQLIQRHEWDLLVNFALNALPFEEACGGLTKFRSKSFVRNLLLG